MTMKRCFTLVEILISIGILALLCGVMYFALNNALESWRTSKVNLSIQKILNEVMDKVSGSMFDYGLRDSLEILRAEGELIEFIPPWVDDTHTVVSPGFIYTLNRRIKPGTSVPMGEVKLPGAKEFKVIPVKVVNFEDSKVSQVKVGISLPRGAELRFTYHPDPEGASVAEKIWWKKDEGTIVTQTFNREEPLFNPALGVKISELRFTYYDNTNNVINERGEVEKEDLSLISGVEIFIEAELEGIKGALMSFVNLRNAPRHSGFLTLRKGTHISIPDSNTIHSLQLINLSGVSNNDELILQAIPERGKTWQISFKFSKVGNRAPQIEKYTIDYPPSHTVYSEYPRRSVGAGIDLLSLDPHGLYDYDNDEEVDDTVLIEGKVTLKVLQMDIEGAGLFVRP